MGSLKDAEISMVTTDNTANPPRVNVEAANVTVWRPIAEQSSFMVGDRLRGDYDDDYKLATGYKVTSASM